MPEYPHAQALLEDARLRLDAYGSSAAALVVEGWDDKRVFLRHATRSQQILVAGGKRLLVAAREAADEDDAKRIIFFADCDYDVPLGKLSPSDGFIITTHADVESDLVSLGILQHVVTEFVASAVHGDTVVDLADVIRTRAVAVASQLGRIRLAAVQMGEPVEVEKLDLKKFRKEHSSYVDLEKMTLAAYGTTSGFVPVTDFAAAVEVCQPNYSACNGHDLVRAVADVMRRDFKARHATEDRIASSVRLSLHREQLDEWDVAARVRAWEDRMGRQVLIR